MSLTNEAQASERLITRHVPDVTFHKFAELPNELKDIIWNFALAPQIVTFEWTISPTIFSPIRNWHGSSIFVKRSRNDVILSVCHASRTVALKEYYTYNLISMSKYSPKAGATPQPPFPFLFQPLQDTWYIPQAYEIREFTFNVNVVEGVLETASYHHHSGTAPYTPAARRDIRLDQDANWGMACLRVDLATFPNLDELIIVVPSTQHLAMAVEKKQKLPGQFEAIICPDPVQFAERVEEFKGELEKSIS
ncbi:uncharacterized protein PAC_15322 [Phialocephala subalpina]|uniref:2EXR domain-containing protein n=1 Tax=Phialocephala subalpina TaxID=576137 RepID=A0A1L7XK50_9HELO|nr:uncharacterized protein PAC_15322 [Phialocephala subalpina]